MSRRTAGVVIGALLVGAAVVAAVLIAHRAGAPSAAWSVAWAGAGAALAAGLALVLVAARSHAAQPHAGSPQGPVHSAASTVGGTPTPVADRDALVALSIDLYDAIDRPSIRERVTRTLAGVGVVPVPSNGVPFDPLVHLAVERVPTSDAAVHGRIADTARPGYVDRGVLVRPAEVTVFGPEGPR